MFEAEPLERGVCGMTRKVKVRAWGIMGRGQFTKFELKMTKRKAYENESKYEQSKHKANM